MLPVSLMKIGIAVATLITLAWTVPTTDPSSGAGWEPMPSGVRSPQLSEAELRGGNRAPAGLSSADQQLANQVSQQIATSDWLGPLAPIALSPYFGITCLAGLAQFGEGTFLESNSLVSQNPVLKNPVVFWVFLVLTLATSIPRFSKVSKPIAQLLDRVETYSAIITLIVIRLAMQEASGGLPDDVRVAGLGSVSWELLMVVAAAVNVVVISTVRFVFELVIWLSPIPTIDGLFEIANKTLCAGLMTLYAFSPLLALVLNLTLFALCAALFFPMVRRAIYMRSLIVDPVLATVFPQMAQLHDGEMVVFTRNRLGPYPAKARLFLRREESGWTLRRPNWLVGSTEFSVPQSSGPLKVQMGMLLGRITWGEPEVGQLIFSRRYSGALPDICASLKLEKTSGVVERSSKNPALELS